MARYDFNAQRLFVEADLAEAATVACDAAQANYLKNVLRLKAGDPILLFNGRDGEWRATMADAGKRGASLSVATMVRAQDQGPDIDYLFAPLKRSRPPKATSAVRRASAGLIPSVMFFSVC